MVWKRVVEYQATRGWLRRGGGGGDACTYLSWSYTVSEPDEGESNATGLKRVGDIQYGAP